MFSLLESWWKRCGYTGGRISDRNKEKEQVFPHCRFLHLFSDFVSIPYCNWLNKTVSKIWMAGRAVRNCPSVAEGHTDDFQNCEIKECPPFPDLDLGASRHWKILKELTEKGVATSAKHPARLRLHSICSTLLMGCPRLWCGGEGAEPYLGPRRQHDHLFDQSFAFGAHFPHHTLVATNQSFAGAFKVGEHDDYVLKGWVFSVVQCIAAVKTVSMLEFTSQCWSNVDFRFWRFS